MTKETKWYDIPVKVDNKKLAESGSSLGSVERCP
jgi:hypothetical protein